MSEHGDGRYATVRRDGSKVRSGGVEEEEEEEVKLLADCAWTAATPRVILGG